MLWDLNDTMKSREAKGKLRLSETLLPGVSVMSKKLIFYVKNNIYVIIQVYFEWLLMKEDAFTSIMV